MKKISKKIEEIYHNFIESENQKNVEERYSGKKKYYHISAVGMCSRRLYFESIDQVQQTNKPNERSSRIMRLGNLVHEDIQDALSLYSNNTYSNNTYSNDTYSDDIYSKEKKYLDIKKRKSKLFSIEQEVIVEDLNIRGFYDLVVHEDGVHLIDFKTIASWPYKKKFGRSPVMDNSNHHELQVASYGLGVIKQFGRLDSMSLCYYNKDNSRLKFHPISMMYLDQAKTYWEEINEEHKRGLPPFRMGTSPKAEWVCNYCSFADHCGSPYKK
tara:strand:- start:28 stop:837 length:810 start_codon:yes stop_codon:yes gene_type:complete